MWKFTSKTSTIFVQITACKNLVCEWSIQLWMGFSWFWNKTVIYWCDISILAWLVKAFVQYLLLIWLLYLFICLSFSCFYFYCRNSVSNWDIVFLWNFLICCILLNFSCLTFPIYTTVQKKIDSTLFVVLLFAKRKAVSVVLCLIRCLDYLLIDVCVYFIVYQTKLLNLVEINLDFHFSHKILWIFLGSGFSLDIQLF